MPVSVGAQRFLDPAMLRSLKTMELKARFLVEGLYASRHRCPFYGYSVEFKEHREYAPGDEPRLIDWKTLGRTGKLFVKRFEMESNMDMTILLDVSASMSYESPLGRQRLGKMEYARYLSAGLAYLVSKQQDAPGLTTFDTDIRDFYPPRQGKRHLHALLATLDALAPRSRTALGDVLKTIGKRLKRRGITGIVSDCLGDTEGLLDGIRHLRARGHDVILFHLLDDDEIELPFQVLSSFQDLESGREVMCDPFKQRKGYRQRLAAFREEIENGCANAGADYVFLPTSRPIETALRDYLLFRRARG